MGEKEEWKGMGNAGIASQYVLRNTDRCPCSVRTTVVDRFDAGDCVVCGR